MSYLAGVDVVVVNYRSPKDLCRFVGSLVGQLDAGLPVDLTIVNVAPTASDRVAAEHAATLAVAHANGLPLSVTVEEHVGNVGYNVACNTAGAAGDREVIVACNADVAFDDSSPVIATLHAGLLDHPDWGIVGPRQIDSKGRLTAPGVYGTLDKPKWATRFRAVDAGQCSEMRADAVTVIGSVFAMRRDTWDVLTGCRLAADVTGAASGPFLETTHWYGETWACYHAAAHGYSRVFDGTVWCRHDHAGALDSTAHGRRHAAEDRAKFRSACHLHGVRCD